MSVSYIKISMSALHHNMKVIRSRLPAEVRILATVKANAYGHGAVRTLQAALEEGFCAGSVARIEEGQELREAGFTCPVYTLGLPLPEEMEAGIEADLTMPVDDTVDLCALDRAAEARGKTARVMIAVDTGMNRIGVHPEDTEALWGKMGRFSHIQVCGTFTHMATADHKDKGAALRQLDRFDEALSHMKHDGGFAVSAANSAGVVDIPRSWYNLARPGIILYGIQPSDVMTNCLDLRPAMSLVSHVVHVQTLHKGEAVGYGGTFVADRDMKTATIPIGYADGYLRAQSNKADILIGGKRCPIVGRVCMDQLMAAVDEHVHPGEEAVLLGRQGTEEITADELAASAGTIPHEIMCSLKRIPRIYAE